MQWFDSQTNGLPEFNQMGALGRVGLILQNIADPTTLPKYQSALQQQQQQQMLMDEQRQKVEKESALRSLMNDPAFASMQPGEQLSAFAKIDSQWADDLINYQIEQNDPMRALDMEYKRAQIAASRRGPERRIVEQGGVAYYADTGEPVVPGAEVPFKPPVTTGLPPGQMWTKDPVTGEPIATNIPGANSSSLTQPTVESEKARRLSRAVIGDLQSIIPLPFDEKGNLNQSVIGQGMMGEGRTFNQALRRAVQNTLYLKSGATAPPQEVEETLRNYQPSILDDKDQAAAKLNALLDFATDAVPSYARTPEMDSLGRFGEAKQGWSIRKK